MFIHRREEYPSDIQRIYDAGGAEIRAVHPHINDATLRATLNRVIDGAEYLMRFHGWSEYLKDVDIDVHDPEKAPYNVVTSRAGYPHSPSTLAIDVSFRCGFITFFHDSKEERDSLNVFWKHVVRALNENPHLEI